MPPLPADLEQRLREHIATLPWYQRLPIQGILRLLQPRAGGLGCLIIVVIIFILAWGIIAYADACASGRLPPWACP